MYAVISILLDHLVKVLDYLVVEAQDLDLFLQVAFKESSMMLFNIKQ